MNNLFILLQAPAPAPQSGMGGGMSSLWMMLLIIVVFYFFMIRPQTKRQKELKKFRESLAKGDKVVTTGGVYGKVSEIQEFAIIMEVAEGVKIKVDKAAIIKDMTDVASK